MNDLAFYFKEGWQHIISLNALDHQLFIITLAAIYLINNWKQVLILVTAFTIGHSITLVLSVYEILNVNQKLIEFLIPCTIIVTAIFNFTRKNLETKKVQLNYFFAFFFGLFHGLGFANVIRFMMAKNQSMGWSLFGFNAGLEAGQILIVAIILLGSYLVINKAGINRQWWIYGLSGLALILSLKFAIERIP